MTIPTMQEAASRESTAGKFANALSHLDDDLHAHDGVDGDDGDGGNDDVDYDDEYDGHYCDDDYDDDDG